jgi:hypothetical protein
MFVSRSVYVITKWFLLGFGIGFGFVVGMGEIEIVE